LAGFSQVVEVISKYTCGELRVDNDFIGTPSGTLFEIINDKAIELLEYATSVCAEQFVREVTVKHGRNVCQQKKRKRRRDLKVLKKIFKLMKRRKEGDHVK